MRGEGGGVRIKKESAIETDGTSVNRKENYETQIGRDFHMGRGDAKKKREKKRERFEKPSTLKRTRLGKVFAFKNRGRSQRKKRKNQNDPRSKG